MDITLTQLIEFLLKYCTGGDVTILLLGITLADTFYAIKWRLKQKIGIFSSTFETGCIVNVGISFIPFFMVYAGHMEHHGHSYMFDVVSLVFGVIFCLSFLQSLIANMKLSGFIFPGWIESIIDKYIQPEIDAKQEKANVSIDKQKILGDIIKGIEKDGKSTK